MKTCRLCKLELETSEFYKTRNECKLCTNKANNERRNTTNYNTVYYAKNQDAMRKRRLENYYEDKKDPAKKLLWRSKQLEMKYGITLEEYNKKLEQQDYRCAICLTDKPVGNGHLHVDHDHKTGKVRGLLCHHCNTSLGGFKDDLEIIGKAIEYLKNCGVIK